MKNTKKVIKYYGIFTYSYDKNCETTLNNSIFNSAYYYHQKSNAISKMIELHDQHEKNNTIEQVELDDHDCFIDRLVTTQGYFFELAEIRFNDQPIQIGS